MSKGVIIRLFLLGSAFAVACAVFESSYFCDKKFPCDCDSLQWCQPVVADKYRKEVIVFAKDKDVTSKTYLKWDWRNITVVYTENFHDPGLMCHAHKHGARYGLRYVLKNISAYYDEESRGNFTQGLLVQSQCMRNDALNLDLDEPLEQDSNKSKLLISLLQDIRRGFDEMIGNSLVIGDKGKSRWQMSFSVPWRPFCFDGMCLPESEIADVVDVLIIKSDHIHNVHDDYWGLKCTAGAHASFAQILRGYNLYMSANIKIHQMVLSVPWYGYKYRCIEFDHKTNSCVVSTKPFHGVNCSFATGERLTLAEVLNIKVKYNATTVWHSGYRTPYFTYKNSTDDIMYQVWYEDEQSTLTKYSYTKEADFLGIAIWYGDNLDYNKSSSKEIQHFTAEMWESVHIAETYRKIGRFGWDQQLAGIVTGIAVSMFVCGTLIGVGIGVVLTKLKKKRKQHIAQEEGDTEVLTEMMETEHKADVSVHV